MNIRTFLSAVLLDVEMTASAQNIFNQGVKMETLRLTQEWDKTFPQSDKVSHKKITFYNRYGITLAADMYIPKETKGKLAAIAVSGPFGAVKEQSSGLYAQTLAESELFPLAHAINGNIQNIAHKILILYLEKSFFITRYFYF